METCTECGFEPTAITVEETPGLIRRFAALHREWLIGFAADEVRRGELRVRPCSGVWSPLEYAGHLRDVCALFDRRVQAVLRAPGSTLEVIDHDAVVARGGYDRLDPRALAAGLGACADRLATRMEGVGPEQWSLYGVRAGERRTIAEIAKRAVHEGRHHLMDVERILASSSGASMRR
ncbi:DinB family protein [Actinoallomurus purpureus]|uniref:DinB family protein n=1 Tax=Actinoallomurus purpureus TaxID=478114 RepID=UPI0020925668|nr:DinB family protein [Actinoallomurus purpureus]MCO6005437.1 DinB family protein [Actinoallomurus purpureus]